MELSSTSDSLVSEFIAAKLIYKLIGYYDDEINLSQLLNLAHTQVQA